MSNESKRDKTRKRMQEMRHAQKLARRNTAKQLELALMYRKKYDSEDIW